MKTHNLMAGLLVMVTLNGSILGQWDNNGDHIYNTNSGNVGIGTSSPINDLHIAADVFDPTNRSTAQASGGLFIKTAGTSGDGNYSGAIVFSEVAGSASGVGIAARQSGSDLDAMGLSFFTHSASHATAPIETMRLTQSRLHLNAGANANMELRIEAGLEGSRDPKLSFYGPTTIGEIYIDNNAANEPWIFRRAETDALGLTILDDGKVGIGTTSPGSKLHLHGGDFKITATDTNGADVWAIGQDGKGIDLFAQNGNGYIKTDTDGMDLILGAGHWGWDGGSNNRQLVLKSGGNVGIGTASPSAKLDILDVISMDHVDNFPAEGSVSEGDWNTYIVAGTGTDGRTLRLGTSNDGYTSSEIELQNYNRWDGSKIFFKTASASEVSPETRMFINYNGRVGIGTTNPQSKLAVNGTITAKEVEVTLTGWPDHVFAESYRLRPLDEVETYIKEHNHLPDMPSAAEVEEDGVGLGDMQAKLLQKVEELTLYVIELKKENEAIKARVAELGSR